MLAVPILGGRPRIPWSTTMVREERPDASANRPQGEVVLGTIAAPGLAGDVTTRVAEELAEDLTRSYGAVGWRTMLEVDRLVEPPAMTTDLIDAARRKLLERGWDLAVVRVAGAAIFLAIGCRDDQTCYAAPTGTRVAPSPDDAVRDLAAPTKACRSRGQPRTAPPKNERLNLRAATGCS